VASYDGYLYVGFGAEDKMQSAADNKAFIEATNEMDDGRGLAEIHAGADHGFAVPGGGYHEAAADRSYQKALEIFEKAVV
jgi:dienelactone hydrolase